MFIPTDIELYILKMFREILIRELEKEIKLDYKNKIQVKNTRQMKQYISTSIKKKSLLKELISQEFNNILETFDAP
jgi:hypothetical protein